MEHTLTATLEPYQKYITLKFNGDISADKLEGFKKDLEYAEKLITENYKEKHQKLHILLDMANFSGTYNVESLNALVEFAKQNKPYVEKTASFGGSIKVKMAGEIAIALSDRDNIKMFNTKIDAIEWLLS